MMLSRVTFARMEAAAMTRQEESPATKEQGMDTEVVRRTRSKEGLGNTGDSLYKGVSLQQRFCPRQQRR